MNAWNFPFTSRPWAIAGLVASALAVVGLILSGFTVFLQAYLFAYLFWLGISLGCLGIATVVYLTRSSWGHISRWILEAGARTLWLMLILFIPIAVGVKRLYPWARPEEVAAHPLLAHKALYLNVPFFLIRAAIYFAVWIFLTHRLSHMAQQPETYEDRDKQRSFRLLGAIAMIAYGLTMTFASIDWIMSLTPDWYSTIFGMLVILGQALSAFAFVLLILPRLARHEPLRDLITLGNYRDLGALLLTCVISWAYLAFSQLLIIWSGNLPQEISWYVDRSSGGWLGVGLLVVAAQFVLPFIVLLSLRAKRNPRLLAVLSLLILLMRLVDNYWLVVPAFSPGQLSIHWLDFVLPVAIGGLWLSVFSWLVTHTAVFIPEMVRASSAAHAETSSTGG